MTKGTKAQLMHTLWSDLAKCNEAEVNIKNRNGKEINIGFINQYAKNISGIPNKWFDWEERVDAKIMIIGQDWGPYEALKPYITTFDMEKIQPDFDYDKFLFKTFSSRTEKFILKSIEQSYREHFSKEINKEAWNSFFFTIAVFFTRQGKHFRGNEFYDEQFGMKLSLPYLTKQIDIVCPKIIMPLGGTAWAMIRSIFGLTTYPEKISSVIEALDGKIIQTETAIIIPNFHPASHTDPKLQYNLWKLIWEHSKLQS